MKKLAILFLALAVILTLTAIPVFAGKGAATEELWDYNGVYGPDADPQVVGWFNVNTTGSGMLRVVVNLSSADEAANLEDLPVTVIIRKQPPCIPSQINTVFVDAISTNIQGQGNATLMVELPDFSSCDPMPTYIMVMVFVNQGGSPLFEGAANLMAPLK